MTNFIEKQYLINQIQLDQFLLNIIKDYCFENKNTHYEKIRKQERNIRFIKNRTMLKTEIHQGLRKHLPSVIYNNIDKHADQLDDILNNEWNDAEKEIIDECNYFEILFNSIKLKHYSKQKTIRRLYNLKVFKNIAIDSIITSMNHAETVYWDNFTDKTKNDVSTFQYILTPLNYFRRSKYSEHFIYLETSEVYAVPPAWWGWADQTPIHIGILKRNGRNVSYEGNNKWDTVELTRGDIKIKGMVNPITNGIHTIEHNLVSKIIGASYKGEFIMF
jgi:hypothetical protein